MRIFSDAQGQVTHLVPDRILPNFEPIRDFMGVLIQASMKALEWSQQISHYKSMGIFPDAQGQLTPQSKV